MDRRRSGPPAVLRSIVLVAALLCLAPYLLAIVYREVAPPSTQMLWRWVWGEPVEQHYVTLSQISPELVRAVATSEDAAFCEHIGIDFRAIKAALRRAEARDEAPHGASTITQQTAKNLFLWQSRSWVRKAIEAPLALWLNLIWPKRRVMEVYLNVAEWGPGLFGAEAAAQRYFGVPASALTAQQAALLATALPNPEKRLANRPSTLHRALAQRLIGRISRAPADLSCLR